MVENDKSKIGICLRVCVCLFVSYFYLESNFMFCSFFQLFVSFNWIFHRQEDVSIYFHMIFFSFYSFSFFWNVIQNLVKLKTIIWNLKMKVKGPKHVALFKIRLNETWLLFSFTVSTLLFFIYNLSCLVWFCKTNLMKWKFNPN